MKDETPELEDNTIDPRAADKRPSRWRGGRLRDGRHERLAHLLAEENSSLLVWPDMAERAGYTISSANRSYFYKQVMKNPDLHIRVLEIRGDSGEVPTGTGDIREEVLKSLRDTRLQAKASRDWTAVNRANELIGKSIGMYTEVTRQADPFEDLGPEELERMVAGLLKDPIVRGMVERSLAKCQDEESAAKAMH